MSFFASLGGVSLPVLPGEETSCELTVRNTGAIVDEFSFQVLGRPAAWAEVDPPRMPLFPDAAGTVSVRFRPPRTSTIGCGPMPFAVKVFSREDPEDTVVEEGVLDIGAFAQTDAALVPQTAKARRSATYRAVLENRGNIPITATLTPSDPNDALEFDSTPTNTPIRPGETVAPSIRAMPRRRYLSGSDEHRRFSVSAQLEPTGEHVTLEGVLIQQPLMPRWLPRGVIATLGVAVALLLAAKLLFPGESGALALSPDSISFGDVRIGGAPVTKQVAVRASEEGIRLIAVSLNPQVAGMAFENGCPKAPATVPTSSGCAVTVSFEPRAKGEVQTELLLDYRGAGESQTTQTRIPVSGVGVGQAVVAIDPPSSKIADTPIGESSTGTLTLTNTGPVPAVIRQLKLTPEDVGFGVSSETCSVRPIPPNGVCEIEISFTPTIPGAASATLIVLNQAGRPIAQADVAAIGLPPMTTDTITPTTPPTETATPTPSATALITTVILPTPS